MLSALRPITRASSGLRASSRVVHARCHSTVDVGSLPVVTTRTKNTVEVVASKIFPAGFGWQAASVAAGDLGYAADSTNFFLMTGAGDFAGVLAGHSALVLAKAAAGRSANLQTDLSTGLWLASAAFCSGTAWQPTVNLLHDSMGLDFASTAVGCGAVTGLAFLTGLRVFRAVYAPLGLAPPDSSNFAGDAMLSVSIGAATGTFVGTDITFADNVLRPLFGVEDSMAPLEGMFRAGASTTAGFFCAQTAQNLVLPAGANWIDPPKVQEAARREP